MAGQRDRRAEEQRRNERARALGFSSRAQMRRAIARGEFVPARGKGNTIVGRAQGPALPPYVKAGFASEEDYRKARRESAKWSKAHSRQNRSEYKPTYEGPRLRAYYDAFVNPDTRANRIENGLASLRHWLVDEMGYITPEEFDTDYKGSW